MEPVTYAVVEGMEASLSELPIFSIPFLLPSLQSLRKLVLSGVAWKDQEPETTESEHTQIAQFAKVLPNIEYLDIALQTWSHRLFQGYCRPRKRNGTFILSFHPNSPFFNTAEMDLGDPDDAAVPPHATTDMSGTALRLLTISKAHFEYMRDWDIQIRLETFKRPRRKRVYGAGPRE